MKILYKWMFLVIIFICLSSNPILSKEISIGLNVSDVQTPESFGSIWKTGIGIVGYFPLFESIGVTGSITRHSLDWEKLIGGPITGGFITGGTVSIANVGLYKKSAFSSTENKWKFYGRFSISYFYLTASDITAFSNTGETFDDSLDQVRNDGVVQIGVGFEYSINPTVSFFIEGGYYGTFKTERIQSIPITLGVSISKM